MKTNTQRNLVHGLAVAGILLFITIMGFVIIRPPAVVSADAPADQFSAERAMQPLSYIGSMKNPIGSEANEVVRDFIMAELKELDLDPILHETVFYDQRLQGAARLGNILARIPGTGSGGAILFMGHYDTVEDAYGASDNGSAVATMLELIRMLQHHPPLQNDLIFLFPDAEEVGLLGAKAFLQEHEWAEDIGLVVNLEAMGTSGRSMMFETAENNLKTISAFAEVVPCPQGTSLSYEIYRRMPNDTDFSPFKQRDYQGLNIAYVGSTYDYHTAGDNLENTSLRSLQHHGSYASAIALKLGNQPLDFEADENAVFFNTLGNGFKYYPYSWVGPITIGIVLLLAGILIAGIIRKRLSLLRVLAGMAGFILHLLVIFILIHSVYLIIAGFYPGNDHLLLEYHQPSILLGFAGITTAFSFVFYRLVSKGLRIWQPVALLVLLLGLLFFSGQILSWYAFAAAGACVIFYLLFRKSTSPRDLSGGALLAWALLMIMAAIVLPGASYLFSWPLLFSLLSLGVAISTPAGRHRAACQYLMILLLILVAVIALSWFPLLTWQLSMTMGLEASGPAMVITGLMVGLLIPHFDFISRVKPWTFPTVVLLAGLAFIFVGSLQLDYNERHRKPVNLQFVSCGNTGESWWVSSDSETNEWSRNFLTDTPDTLLMTDLFPYNSTPLLVASANERPPVPPSVILLDDRIENGERVLKLKIIPEQETARISHYFQTNAKEVSIRLGENTGNPLDPGGQPRQPLHPPGNSGWQFMFFFAPPENGYELTIYASSEEPVQLHLNSHVYGLPEVATRFSMPDYMMSRRMQSVVSVRQEW
ncbi:MAG: M28 family peptidase [Bacteroidales bacterium]